MKKLLLILFIPLLMGFSCSLFKNNKTEQVSQGTNLEAAANLQNEKSNQELTLDVLKAKLKNIKSAHFYETISYSENSSSTPQISESEGDLVYPYDFDYKMFSMTTPLEDEAMANTGLEGIGYMFSGAQAKRLDGRVYLKPNMEHLAAMNILSAEDIASFTGDLKEYFYNWSDVTYEGLNYYPGQLISFWALADMPSKISQINGQEYLVEVDENITYNYSMQYYRITDPSSLSSLEFFEESKNKGEEPDKVISEMSVFLNDDMDLEKIIIIDKPENSDKDEHYERVLIFSGFNQVKEISPITEKIINSMNTDLNFVRFERAKFIYYTIEYLFEGKTYPKTDSIVRLDDQNNALVQDIIQKSADEILKKYPYLNRDFEKDIFINLFKDPKPDKYYYGYQYIDDNSFRISFIQELSESNSLFSNESSICSQDLCINFFAGEGDDNWFK